MIKKWLCAALAVVILCASDYAVARGPSDTSDNVYEFPGDLLPHGESGKEPSLAIPFLSQEVIEEFGVPLLQNWISQSRQDALRAGTDPIPEAVRANLSGFFSDRLLDRVRFRVGEGNELSLQTSAFLYGNASAITLGDVIIFRNQRDALYDYSLWAHELAHVQQYRRWGIEGFARRYIQNYTVVEREAEDTTARFDLWYRKVMGRSPEHRR